MANENDNGWGQPTDQPGAPSASDWSTPQHQAPQGDFHPQRYQGGPPSGGTGKDLETSDIVAMAVTFFIPGVGQMMLGQTVKGLVVLGIAILTGCGLGLVSIGALVDAYLVAVAKKKRPVGEWEFFPDFKETFNF